MDKKYKATAYLRLSGSEDRSKESESITNQRAIIDNFVQQNNDIEIVAEQVDDGYTGQNFDRPGFKEMMNDVISGKVNCIIVKDMSRFGREWIDTGEYIKNVFPKLGIRFIAIADNIDNLAEDNLYDRLEVRLKTLINDEYSYDISKKVRSSVYAKKKKGDFVASYTVYGYEKDKNNKNKLVVDKYASEVVKDVFRMKKQGMSAKKIAEVLNERKILSPYEYKKSMGMNVLSGKRTVGDEKTQWSPTTIIRMLKEENYTGDLLQGRRTTHSYKLKKTKEVPREQWLITKNAHESIISREDFDLVQQLMSLDTRTSPNQNQVYIFSGILICGSCGNRVTRKTNRSAKNPDKVYHYYNCPTPKKNGCTMKMIREEELIELVTETTKSHILNIINLGEFINKIELEPVNIALFEKYIHQLENIKSEINNVKIIQGTLLENNLNGIISNSEYKQLKQSYKLKLNKLENSYNELVSEYEESKNNSDNILKWTDKFKEFQNIKILTREIAVQLISSIVIGEEITITYRYQLEYENMLSLISENNLPSSLTNKKEVI